MVSGNANVRESTLYFKVDCVLGKKSLSPLNRLILQSYLHEHGVVINLNRVLPDFPLSKAILRGQFNRFFKRRLQYWSQGMFVNEKIIHEGKTHASHYKTGVTYESGLKTIESKFQLTTEEIFGDQNLVLEKVDDMIKNMADQKVVAMFEQISSVCDATGQTNSDALTPESVIKTYDSVEMDCDGDGELIIPTIHAGPELCDKFKKIVDEILGDEVLRPQLMKVFEQKKQDWFERENNRKLVD